MFLSIAIKKDQVILQDLPFKNLPFHSVKISLYATMHPFSLHVAFLLETQVPIGQPVNWQAHNITCREKTNYVFQVHLQVVQTT